MKWVGLAFTEAVASDCFFVFSFSLLIVNRKCLIHYHCWANPITLWHPAPPARYAVSREMRQWWHTDNLPLTFFS